MDVLSVWVCEHIRKEHTSPGAEQKDYLTLVDDVFVSLTGLAVSLTETEELDMQE